VEKSKTKLKRSQRIFVNRSLNMANIKAIGFDMDHTLICYNRETFEEIAFYETVKKFVEAGYPEELSQLKFIPDFVIRGLLVDIDRGNVLKVDCHKYVKLAFHGKTVLDKETRHRLYNIESLKAYDFLTIDSFFALSEVQLFCEIVDYMDKHPGSVKKTYREVYADLRKFIDLSHQDGTIKSHIFKQPEKFLMFDKHLTTALIRLLDANKVLFLLTNSPWDYTDKIMSLVFDQAHKDFPRWRDYFQYTIVGAGKPTFFTNTTPFHEVDPKTGEKREFDGSLEYWKIYHGGNAGLFQRLSGLRGDEILYVGDHLYSDIIRSKDLLNWRTLVIMPELIAEMKKLEAVQPIMEKILDLVSEKEILDEELQILKSKISSNTRQAHILESKSEKKKAYYLDKSNEKIIQKAQQKEKEIEEVGQGIRNLIEEREAAFHPVWGELMKVNLERSRFANQVVDYACIYTTQVSNLRFYSPSKRFISTYDILPHEL